MMISMIEPSFRICRQAMFAALALLSGFALAGTAAAQELEQLDPDQAFTSQDAGANTGIDADLMTPQQPPAATSTVDESFGDFAAAPATTSETVAPVASDTGTQTGTAMPADGATPATYGEDDLIGAAEGVFGKGAEGLAKLIEDLLKKQGQPNAYIVGREAGGAFIVGARYGSGTLHHKVEGTQQVYWTGPSIGFDAGANASNTFVLVYNLYDSQDLFERFPAGEGQAYFVGGLHASYLRRGDVVLIPIRVGAGLRLGVNAGYMRFSKKQRWSPF